MLREAVQVSHMHHEQYERVLAATRAGLDVATFSQCNLAGLCCAPNCAGSDRSCGSCLVVVTSTYYDGNLGDLSGAGEQCLERATAGSRPGTYKAWLSTSTGPDASPATGRFRQSRQPYRRVDGMTVATSWTDLVDGTDLANPINVTEIDTTIAQDEFGWTNTKPDGTAGCKGFMAPCGIYPIVDDCQDRGTTVGDASDVNCLWTAVSRGHA